jgi:hypothetical protein
MEKKYPKKKGQPYSAIPRKPLHNKAEESTNSLYHLVIALAFGFFFCLSMCVLDYVAQDTAPSTNMTETIEFFGEG